jgi:hypothetical protein
MYSQQLQLWADPAKRRHRLPPASAVPDYKEFKRAAAVAATAVTPALATTTVEFTCPSCQQLHNGEYAGTVVCERQGCLNVMCLPKQPIIAPDAALPAATSEPGPSNVAQPRASHQGESWPERSAQEECTGQARPGTLRVGSRVALNAKGQAVDSSYSWRLDPLTPLVHGTVQSIDVTAGTVRVQSDLPDRADSDYDPNLLVTLPPLPVCDLPKHARQQDHPGPGCYMRDGSGRFLRRKTFAWRAGDCKELAGDADLLVHRSNPGCSVRGCSVQVADWFAIAPAVWSVKRGPPDFNTFARCCICPGCMLRHPELRRIFSKVRYMAEELQLESTLAPSQPHREPTLVQATVLVPPQRTERRNFAPQHAYRPRFVPQRHSLPPPLDNDDGVHDTDGSTRLTTATGSECSDFSMQEERACSDQDCQDEHACNGRLDDDDGEYADQECADSTCSELAECDDYE